MTKPLHLISVGNLDVEDKRRHDANRDASAEFLRRLMHFHGDTPPDAAVAEAAARIRANPQAYFHA